MKKRGGEDERCNQTERSILMKFAMYSRFLPTLARLGAEACADELVRLGLSHAETLAVTGSPLPEIINDTKKAEAVRKVFASRGLSFACYSVGTCLWQNPDAERELLYHAEIAAALGSPYLHHTLLSWFRLPECPPDPDDAIAFASEAAVRVAKAAAPLGISCIYEDQGLYCNGVEGFGKFYSEVKRVCPSVGVCGDMGNSLFVGTEPEVFFRAFAKEIRHVHVKDYLRKTSDEMPGKYWLPIENGKNHVWVRDTIVGDGTINFAACMEVLHSVGYDGVFALELEHPEPFEEGILQAERVLSAL